MVRYFQEDIRFDLKQKMQNNRWLKMVAGSEMRRLGAVNIIFCSDRYILDVNMKYLQHDYFTDIITFDYCEKDILSGDLFISIDSVRENALFYGTEFENELNRQLVSLTLSALMTFSCFSGLSAMTTTRRRTSP